jgi:phosphoglycolate phosphatase|tara:strand:- start:26 stop:784 length:759 start_codon:yes stop_codon:yes gene_type:complete
VVNIGINEEIIDEIELVIFDKDGTLVDLYNYWANMINFRVVSAQKKLGFDESKNDDIMYAMGVDVASGRLRSEGPVGLKKREIVMQAMVDSLAEIGFPDTYNTCFQIFKEVDEQSVNHLKDIVKPVNGMHELINTLYEKNCKIAVATTDKTARADLVADFLGMSDKVNIVIGEDMVVNCKPHPDMANLILKELSVDKENTVIVGDAITDIEMGLNAGLKASIGVCSGLASERKLGEKTDYVIEDISMIRVLG